MAVVFNVVKHSMSSLVLLLLIASLVRLATARPPWDSTTGHDQCNDDEDLLDLCQRCAKLTKSNLAYPACCSNTDLQARKWCGDYVYFGRGDYDFN